MFSKIWKFLRDLARRTWKFFCSVKLTVVLFVLILIPSVAGTIVQQNADDPSVYEQVYGPIWSSVFGWLGFYDIYHDPRFVVLLAMLALNTFVCTVNRFRPKWRMAGMLMTHVGLLMILLGALVGATLGVKGFMAIGEGEALEAISVRHASGREMEPIPFKVKLLDFILDMHEEPAHRLVVVDVRAGEQRRRHLELGKKTALVEPRWSGIMALLGVEPDAGTTVEPRRFYSNAANVTTLTEGPEETGRKAVEVRLTGGGVERRGFAEAGSPNPYLPSGTHVGIFYAKLDSPDRLDSEIQNAIAFTKVINRLDVTAPGAVFTTTHSAEVGANFEVEGHTIEVLRYVADFVIMDQGQVSTRSEFPHNPAIQVRITGPEGEKTEQWMFAKFPEMHTQEGSLPFKLKYARTGPGGHVADYVFIFNATGAEPVAVHARAGKLVNKAAASPGTSLALEGAAFEVGFNAFYENANVNRELKESDEAQGRPAVEVVIEQDGEQTEHFLWADTPVDVPGYRLVYVEEDRVRDYFSILQIVDGDEVVMEKKIEVNDPLRYGGYAFYQSSYDREGLNWSGLQVRKDPGVPLVYGGFVAQILGMIVIFYINPLIRKARKARAE